MPIGKQKGGSLSDFWRKRDAGNANRGLIGKSQSFFKNQINKLKGATLRKFGDKAMSQPTIGSMVFFGYDPKHKKTLPMYDRLPLVIPIEHYKDGFLGINLHYLPPSIRFKFLKELIKIGSRGSLTDDTRLRLSYSMLKGAASSKMFAPTIHRYLYPHVRTKIMSVKPTDWKLVVFLPSAKWAKGKPY